MKNKRFYLLGSAVSACALVSATAAYAVNVDLTANFSVLTDVTLTEVQPMSFGTLVAFESNYNVPAALVMNADGSMVSATSYAGPIGKGAALIQSAAGQQGIYEVNVGHPEVKVKVTLPSAAVDLTHATASQKLSVSTFKAAPTTFGNTSDEHSSADGIYQFQVGATISTDGTGTKTIGDTAGMSLTALPDGAYSGNMEVKVTLN